MRLWFTLKALMKKRKELRRKLAMSFLSLEICQVETESLYIGYFKGILSDTGFPYNAEIL